MNSKIYQEEGLRHYLHQTSQLSPSSQNSYLSGIRKVFSIFTELHPNLSLESYIHSAVILAAGDPRTLELSLQPIIAWLGRRKELVPQSNKKDYQNYISHMKCYIRYLCGVETDEAQEIPIGQNAEVVSIFKTFYLSEEYEQWLEDSEKGLGTHASIRCYLTTLRSPKAMNWVGKDTSFRFSMAKEESREYTLAVIEEVEKLIGLITIRLEETKAKDLSDQRSHLRKYITFLRDRIEQFPESIVCDIDEAYQDEESTLTDTQPTVSPLLASAWEAEDIRGNFYFRLTSQDRLTKKEGAVYYPIRLLRRLFVGSEYQKLFETKINEQIGAIEVVVDELGHTILLRDVDKISILPNKEVFVYSKGKKLRMYTSDAKSTRFYPMDATELGDIQIDHKTTISSILTKLGQESRLPKLRQLTDVLRGLEASYGGDVKGNGLSKKFFEDESKKNAFIPFLSELMAEVEMIQKATGLQLMSRYENARKKKN